MINFKAPIKFIMKLLISSQNLRRSIFKLETFISNAICHLQACIEEKLQPVACFQAALLYTSSKGDRRIRVHTICLPTTGDLQKIYEHFDVKAAISLLVKIGEFFIFITKVLARCFIAMTIKWIGYQICKITSVSNRLITL